MSKYSVKRYWEMCDEVIVEAKSSGAAILKAHELPLTDGEYVPDSINSDSETDVRNVIKSRENQHDYRYNHTLP